MNVNPALLPLAERARYYALLELRLCIRRYKATRTSAANRPSGVTAYHLRRAEHDLVNATRQAASFVIDRNQ